jgi:hypothetical protein
LRGNAQQLHEKYTSLGNESAAAGERITAEAYYQYADHYFRVHSTIMANMEDRRQSQQQSPSQSSANGSDTESNDVPVANGKTNGKGDAGDETSIDETQSQDESVSAASNDGDDKDKDQPSSMVS